MISERSHSNSNGIILECQICCEDYEIKTKRPLVMDCGHSICEVCLGSIIRSTKKCPFDKKELRRTIDQYPINWSYIDIISSKHYILIIIRL